MTKHAFPAYAFCEQMRCLCRYLVEPRSMKLAKYEQDSAEILAKKEAKLKEYAAKMALIETKRTSTEMKVIYKEVAAKMEVINKDITAKMREKLEALKAERKEEGAKIEAECKEFSIAKFIEENRELAISHCQPSIPPDNETAREAWEAFDRSQKRGAGRTGGRKSKRKRGKEETNDEETDEEETNEEETKKPGFHNPIPFYVARYFGNYLDFPFKHEDEEGNYNPCSILMKAHVFNCPTLKLPVQNERTLQGYLECVKSDTFMPIKQKHQ